MGQELSQEISVEHLVQGTGAAQQADQAKASEVEHEQLQNIVNNLVKLTDEIVQPKPVKITRITHHEIKSMRATQNAMPAAKNEPIVKTSALIQTFDAFLSLFKHGEKRSRCSVEGHECKHCGQTVKLEDVKGDKPVRGH